MGKLRILSDHSRPFAGRREAGSRVAGELEHLKGEDAVVLGIPRGGIVPAREIASRLGAVLDVVLARKIGSPLDPEAAVAAVAENGEIFTDMRTALFTAADDGFIQKEKERQLEEIERRKKIFRKIRRKECLEGKTVVLTDDGIATGAAARAAVWAIRSENPAKITAAFPVGERAALQALSGDTDEVLCLQSPRSFASISAYYSEFNEVTDEDVSKILLEYCGK